MRHISDYLVVCILSYVIILELLRIVRLFFNVGFLRHKRFEFPDSRIIRAYYCLSSILVYLAVILLKLKII